MQTGKIAVMPVVLFGEAFWRRVVNFEALVEEGVISPNDLELFHFVETAEEAWAIVQKFYAKA
jgi:predicted Rossmann-fold nucleotide-binding protein